MTDTAWHPVNKRHFRWENLFHFRFWLGVAVSGMLFALPFSLLHWETVAAVFGFIGIAIGLWAGIAASTSNELACPKCKKRVKMGAKACHHCGASAV